jgi:predicted transcriptional regulator of viral defense system
LRSKDSSHGLRGGLGKSEREVLAVLASLERPSVGAADVLAARPMGRTAANLLLSRLARKGWLRRLRRGAYTVVPLSSGSATPPVESPLAVAMQLFAPCYISGWSAAQHWALTDQIFNAVAVFSAKPQRRGTQLIAGITYRVRRVRTEKIFGTTRVWAGSVTIEMADLHRTLIDVLDAPEMGGGGPHTLDIVRAYWARSDADPQRLLEYAARLGRGTVFKRLGFFAERFGRVDPAWLTTCRDNLSAGVSLLDPAGPARGPVVSRWRLRVNLPIEAGP